MKKYFLSSMLVMGLMAPAFGADEIITGGPNTCTVDVLGVSDNNATAKTIATWTPVTYECAPGQYLLETETSVECTPCPIGSYCPGGTYTVESENTGATTCPTDYTSDAGSTAESECYIGCELSCIQNVCPENSKNCTYGTATSNGKQFYGQTACDATPQFCSMDFECKAGYSKITISAETFAEYIFGKTWEDSPDDLDSFGWPAYGLGCSWDGSGIISRNNTVTEHPTVCQFLKPGQIVYFASDFSGAVLYEVTKNEYDNATFPEAKCKEDNCVAYNQNFMLGNNGNIVWLRSAAVLLPSADTEILFGFDNGSINIPDGLTEQEQIEFVLGMASSEMATRIMANPELVDDMLQLLFLSYVSVPMNNIWVGNPNMLKGLGRETEFESALQYLPILQLLTVFAFFGGDYIYLEIPFGNIGYCKNNKINIDWNADNGTDNFRGMCYYDQGITLPTDPVRPGYTFTGWKLVE